jgi:hypothetical protein
LKRMVKMADGSGDARQLPGGSHEVPSEILIARPPSRPAQYQLLERRTDQETPHGELHFMRDGPGVIEDLETARDPGQPFVFRFCRRND